MAALDARKVRVPAEEDTGRVAPVLCKGGLQEANDGSFDPHVGLLSVPALPAFAHPLGADAGPTREAHPPIDDQDSAVVAMIDSFDGERIQRVRPGEVTAGLRACDSTRRRRGGHARARRLGSARPARRSCRSPPGRLGELPGAT
jgi:hypothetical protein